jgi:hypothetical protein
MFRFSVSRLPMFRLACAGFAAALLVSMPAAAQQAPDPDDDAPVATLAAPTAPAKKLPRSKASKKAPAKNAVEVVFVNNRSSAVNAVTMTGQAGKASSMLKGPLQPGKKVSVRLRKNAGCTFTVDASFADEAPFEATEVDLCADKTISFTE